MNYHSLERLIHLPSKTPSGIKAIYLNIVIRRLGLSIVGIFFPVFLFLESQKYWGNSLTVGIYGLATYFILMQFTKLLCVMPSVRFINNHGFRRTIFFGNIFLVLVLYLLTYAEGNYLLLIPIAIIHGLATSLYWTAYHTLFATDGASNSLGKEVSISKLLERGANIVGPIVGGVIVGLWGFPVLFWVALIIVIISSIPFFFMGKHAHSESLQVGDVFLWFGDREHRNEIVSKFGRHLDDKVSALIFPIFAFLIVGTFEKQGLIEAIALFVGSISVYFAGRYFDKYRSRKTFTIGVSFTAFLTIVRGFVSSFGSLLLLDGARKAMSPFYWLTYDSLWYRKSRSKSEGALMFAVVNAVLSSAATFFVLISMMIFASASYIFWVAWILQAVGVSLSLSLWSKGKKYE